MYTIQRYGNQYRSIIIVVQLNWLCKTPMYCYALQTGEIGHESRLRVKHKHTETWLHLNKGKSAKNGTCIGMIVTLWLYTIIFLDERHTSTVSTVTRKDLSVSDDFDKARELFQVMLSLIITCILHRASLLLFELMSN